MAEESATSGRDQDINPWSVEGAQDENGEVASIDYQAICLYVAMPWVWRLLFILYPANS